MFKNDLCCWPDALGWMGRFRRRDAAGPRRHEEEDTSLRKVDCAREMAERRTIDRLTACDTVRARLLDCIVMDRRMQVVEGG